MIAYKSQFEVAFTPAVALKKYDFWRRYSEMGNTTCGEWPDVEIWYAEHNSTKRSRYDIGGESIYSWRGWIIKSSEIDILDCKDPHFDGMLEYFRPMELQTLVDMIPGDGMSNIIMRDKGKWHYLVKEYGIKENTA